MRLSNKEELSDDARFTADVVKQLMDEILELSPQFYFESFERTYLERVLEKLCNPPPSS